jgi:hypothetical protein
VTLQITFPRVLLAAALLATAAAPALLSGAEKPPRVRRLASAHVIPDEATWQRLAARPEAWAVARTEVVKFLVDRDDRRKLWFTDTERFPFHYDFARDRLSSPGRPVLDHGLFNAYEYHDQNRRFEMGSIVRYLDADLWTLELVSSDTLTGEEIVRLFGEVRNALWIGDRLQFHPLSDLHEQNIAAVRDRLPVADADEVFGGINFQPLTTGTTFGYLRVVDGALDPATVRADQILLLARLPEEIPVNAGVISQELQAPLGHIAILCATRGTPNMALRDALARPELRSLEGRLVELIVGPQEFSVRPATTEEAEKAWARRRPRKPQVPRLDAEEARLLDVSELRMRDTRFAGAKAAQLGEVTRLKGVVTPGGFVIPLSYYLAHVAHCGAANNLATRLADDDFNQNTAVRAAWLAEVRATIAQAPINAELVRQVRERILALAPASRWILRSSTNAEDLAGFTGAGLYRSLKLQPGASDAEIADAIRGVWASVWLQSAFEERAWYRIDHAAVGMAILVQPFVDGAVVNGVAITANPFAEMRPAFFVNAQALGGSVTGAGGNELPEQLLIYTFVGDYDAEVLARSSRTGGQPLLADAEIRALATVLERLHRHFVPKWRGPANAVDVEFLIAGEDRHVVILQARPYTVVYGPGQRMEDVPADDAGRFPGWAPGR